MTGPSEIALRTKAVFDEIHRSTFLGDPAANPRLKVEVVEPARVAGMVALVLVTPWTLNGLVFAGDHHRPASLTIGGKRRPVFLLEADGLDPCWSVNLVADVSGFTSHDEALAAGRAIAEEFRSAVSEALDEAGVENPSRRAFLRGVTASDDGDGFPA